MTHPTGKLSTPIITQVALVVKDIEKTSKAFADLLGVETPAWKITGELPETHATYRGQPMEARARLAFFDLGSVTIELIEPVGGPSVWQEFLDTRGEGVQHIAFRVPDMDEEIAMLDRKGMPVVQRGDFTSGCYTYIDSTDKLGVMLELLQF